MSWFWLNIPFALICVAAWSGIPLWLLLRHPAWHRERGARFGAEAARREPVYVPVPRENVTAGVR
jgi:hypothetical protein